VPTDELDRRLAALAEAAQEHADAPAAAVIRARARWRRARNAAAAAMAVAAAAALLAVIRPALVRDSEVAGPSPSVSTSPGVVPWVREPARRRAPTPTSPGARPAERCSFGTSTSARAPSSSPSNWCVPDRALRVIVHAGTCRYRACLRLVTRFDVGRARGSHLGGLGPGAGVKPAVARDWTAVAARPPGR
jgi:hypothetical protein